MKLITLVIFSIVLLNVITKEASKDQAKEKIVIDRTPDQMQHAYATNDPYILQHQAGFKTPRIVDRLPAYMNHDLNTGEILSAAATVKDKFYYDGSDNLSAIHVDCNVNSTNPPACVHNAGCGWCGEKNNCISGNASGPLAPCLRNTFLYSAPTPEWNPLKAGHINILALNDLGQPQIHLTSEPNLRKMDVMNPYH